MRYLLALLFLVSTAHAATYFIDSVNGVNSNNGTSQATPWFSPPGSSCECPASGICPIRQCLVNSVGGWPAATKIHAGDSILFKSGESFSFLWDVSPTFYDINMASDLTISNYDPVGGQPAPIIEGGTDPTTLTERTVPNFFATISANVYAFNFNCSRLANPTADGVQTMRNGVRFGAGVTGTFDSMNATGVASCGQLSVPYSEFLDCANNRVCVDVPAGINPNNDPAGTWYVGWRRLGVYLEASMSHFNFSNLTFRRKGTISGVGGGEIEMQAGNGATGGGQNNITVNNCTFDSSGGTGLRASMDGFTSTPCAGTNLMHNLTYTNNTSHDNWSYGIEISNCDNSVSTNFLEKGNTHYHNGDHGFQCSGNNGCTITQNTSYENGVGNSQCGNAGLPCGPNGERTGTGVNVSGSRFTAAEAPHRYSNNSVITRNHIWGNGYGCRVEPNVIQDALCFTDNCNGACSGIYSDSVIGVSNVYANNVIHDNYGSCVAFNSAGNSVGAVFTIYNNSCMNDLTSELFDFNGGWGNNQFDIEDNSFPFMVPGSTPSWPAVFWKSSLTQIFKNNDTFSTSSSLTGGTNCTGGACQFFCASGYQPTPCAFSTLSGNFQSNPSYTAIGYGTAANLVPTTSPASPLIGAGANTSPTVVLDFNGLTRGLPYDIGAYQVGTATGTTSTTTSTSTSTSVIGSTTSTSTSTTVQGANGAQGGEPDRGPKVGGPP